QTSIRGESNGGRMGSRSETRTRIGVSGGSRDDVVTRRRARHVVVSGEPATRTIIKKRRHANLPRRARVALHAPASRAVIIHEGGPGVAVGPRGSGPGVSVSTGTTPRTTTGSSTSPSGQGASGRSSTGSSSMSQPSGSKSRSTTGSSGGSSSSPAQGNSSGGSTSGGSSSGGSSSPAGTH